MGVILVLAHGRSGRSGERMRPGWDNVAVDPWMLDEAWVG